MESIFPLVKKYGGFVVALTLDEDGIPDNSEKRIEIAKKIYETAEKYMPVPSDLKQQEHNDDNYYRGGRIR